MEITLFQGDWEEVRKDGITTVMIDAPECTLEVKQSAEGTEVHVLTGKPDIVYSRAIGREVKANMPPLFNSPDRLYYYNDKGINHEPISDSVNQVQ